MSLPRAAAVFCLIGGLIACEAVRLRRSGATREASKPEAALYQCAFEVTPPPQTGNPAAFTDVTDSVELDFQHVAGPLGTYFMPESIGAGGAMFDYDGDGRLDIYLVNCGRSPEAVGEFPPGTRIENRLFRQTESGTFEDVTETSGLGDTGFGAGCAVGDVNNDGHPDVYVTNYGPDRLYLSNGNGTFSDVTEAAGVHNPDWGTCAAFVDYNRDGWLDLVVVNYTADPQHGHSIACGFQQGTVSYCGPHKFEPTLDRLFRNEGLHSGEDGRTAVRFTDVTQEAGLAAATTYGFGVVCADFTGDGWVDLYIANDAAPNRLWANQRDGRFVDEALPRGAALSGDGLPEGGMGTAVGDVDRDGRLDIVVTNLSQEKTTLYLDRGEGTFADATDEAGLRGPTRMHTGWGTALIDLDHDGLLDLPIVNGLVIPCHSRFPFHGEDEFVARRDVIDDPQAYWRDYADPNVLMMGRPEGRFVDATASSGDFGSVIASGRALIHGDIDNDGDLDLLVTNCGGRARL